MNTKISGMVVAAVVACASVVSISLAAQNSSSVNTPVTALKYGPTGVSDGVHGELNAAPAYGDLGHGPHGTFVKMPAGFVSKVHTHTDDYWGVVIGGVAANGKPGSTDVALPVGSYWFQKGGESHVTKCLSPSECIFFISQNGKFDYLADEKK